VGQFEKCCMNRRHREQARSHRGTRALKKQVGGKAALLLLCFALLCFAFAFDLPAPLPTLAERRYCVVGNPAWMPG
jgi:hypothetical protein